MTQQPLPPSRAPLPGTPTPVPAGPIEPQPANAQAGPGGAFGRILVERGLATEEQIEKCLQIQMKRAKAGDFVRLGAILVEEGILTPPQVAEILQQQAITVLVCEACGAQYNVTKYSPVKEYECRRCHGKLVPPTGKLKSVAVQDAVEDQPKPRPAPGEPTSGTAKIRQRRRLGRYEILGEIARGGMGVIYKARQLDLDRVIALKTLRADEAQRADGEERFRREAQAVAGLRHPNLVAVHDVGQIDGIPYFTMEFIEGLPLDRRILRGPLDAKEATAILAPIAEALHYCHGEGVVHRDLKPANIIVDAHGVPFLVDFGIAKRKNERGPDLDNKDELLGSIPYMAPEYVAGAAYDELCDVYSFGVVLYEVLTGHECFPYYDKSTTRLLEKIADEPPLPILERAPHLDKDVASIVMKAIARNRPDRYVSAGALAHDLRAFLRGEPVVANPRSALEERVRALSKKAPSSIVLLLGALAIVASVLAIVAFGASHASQKAVQLAQGEAEAARLERDQAVLDLTLKYAAELEKLDRPVRAIEVLTVAIEKYAGRTDLGQLAEAYQRRGKLRVANGEVAAGEEDLARARRLDPRIKK